MPFNLVQLAVAGLAVAPIAIVGGVGELALSAVVAAVWCGIAQGAALALQVVAQRSVDSTSSALILLLVPVTGAALSYVLVGDRMGAVGIVGALLILTAVIVAEVLPTLRAGRRGAAALGVEPSP
jgi:DME family drug/metabolite transporter